MIGFVVSVDERESLNPHHHDLPNRNRNQGHEVERNEGVRNATRRTAATKPHAAGFGLRKANEKINPDKQKKRSTARHPST